MGAACKAGRAIFCFTASWKRAVFSQAALLMLECDRSLASHRYTPDNDEDGDADSDEEDGDEDHR
jgi:hypothetical protein